ncbi:chemotaxis protein CheW [Brachyspira aalborgi]|jgi:purine-binding chemotaxis protein|uniref:Chemotaxis protein CheW n=1 Tax=Brachyspira aalborgi TaxID=29522 RepID=A0A5C8FGK9_9SPIR|nr:chemotaxis protein CheW [Brachyspira aalborgi]MBS4763701.1 chemotaxis protein CheW [Brachyspira sp.]CCY77402.1 purine-binding chemotaxis protein [Brachyspira sp. CAG:700]TXJ13428.1 chemotaxis protein CheW [Brachyspira aalborgi]TXJ15941.1 chemotaxis protein CheW [Brachyspira aalborgi]TXJ19442.1 chemotaxis protein CheW [Brachyspira aalborgi]
MSNQILVFNINNELYGIDILKVQEILNFIQPTPIPNCPDYLKGIINLRGTIILVIDLRARFHFDSPMDPNNCVIVVVAIGNKKYGLVVDSVSDVLTINEENIQEDIDIHSGIDNRYIMGLVKANEQMIILVNIDKVFLKNELDDLNSAVNNSVV